MTLWRWIPLGINQAVGQIPGAVGDWYVDVTLRVDSLSALMLLFVTFVGFLIHVYSSGYMGHEEGYGRFFAYLNLFMFAMLVLVLGGNFLMLFVGWEGVGLCSYLLIGYYYEKKFAADAGKKAFVVNRIGDFGFILGIFARLRPLRLARLPEGLRGRGGQPGGVHAVHDRRLPAALRRGVRQVGAVPALRLAAGRHGRPDARLGADPRRDDGHGRRLHGRALQRVLPHGARTR